MDNRKLTEEEIDQLFAVCDRYSVKYFDVQIELVDHLACKIEDMWVTKPQLSFDEALFSVLKEFGVDPLFHASFDSLLPSPFPRSNFNSPSVFEKIKESKEKELVQKYSRLQRRYLAEFFKLPKIVLTAALVFSLFLIFSYSENYIKSAYLIIGGCFVVLVLFLFLFYPKKLKLMPLEGKSFLLFNHYKKVKYLGMFIFLSAVNLVNIPSIFSSSHRLNNNYWEIKLLLAFLLAFFMIGTYVITVYIPYRIKEDFTREFPQFVKN